MKKNTTQRTLLLHYMQRHPLARSFELKAAGISATTISRALNEGIIDRIGHGLYQLIDSDIDGDTHFSLIEASRKVPNGVICMTSALAFYGLTDQIPRKIWIAIGEKDWKPDIQYPPVRYVRFRPNYLNSGVEYHDISGITVPIFSIEKSLADVFRNSRLIDRSVAIECLKSAIRGRKTSSSRIAEIAKKFGAWKQMRPYLEAISFDG